MATTTVLFKTRFPEFDSIDGVRVQLFLDDAALSMDTGIWGNIYDVGQAYLAAHYLSLALKSSVGARGGAAISGPLTGRTVDGVSVTYGSSQSVGGANSQTAGYYNLTQYGQRYMVLMKNLGAMVSTV